MMQPSDFLAYEAEINDLRGAYAHLAAQLPAPIVESDEAKWAIDFAEQEVKRAKSHPAQAAQQLLDEAMMNAERAVTRLRELIEAASDMQP